MGDTDREKGEGREREGGRESKERRQIEKYAEPRQLSRALFT